MTDPFASSRHGFLPFPEAGTRHVPAGGDWRETAPGFFEITLLDDAATGLRTVLMKMEPDCWSPSHSHDYMEQIYVVEGEFYDDDTNYGAGDYLVRAAGTPHVAGSHQGATVLIVYSPVGKGVAA